MKSVLGLNRALRVGDSRPPNASATRQQGRTNSAAKAAWVETMGSRAAKTVIPGKEFRSNNSWKNAGVKDGGGFAGLRDACVVIFPFPGTRMSVDTPTVMNPAPVHLREVPSCTLLRLLTWMKCEAIVHAAAPDENPRGPIALLARDCAGRLSPTQTTTARYVHPTPIPPTMKETMMPSKDAAARKWPARLTARPQRIVPAAVTVRALVRSVKEVHVATPIDRPIVAKANGA